MLPQTIIWYAMLMRGGIKAERTRTANRILRARQVLVLPERRPPARPDATTMVATRRAGGRRSNLARDTDRSVAQVGNLLCRRLAVGKRLKLTVPADYQSAIRQTASLRYDFSLDRAGGPDTLAAMRTGRTKSHLAA